jgi:hypothetical protein
MVPTISRLLAMSVIVAASLTGCASPRGSSWAVADFNKYDLNYDRFPTEQLQIGQLKAESVRILGDHFKTVEASEEGEVLSWDRWVSVQGPDYVAERLLIRFRDGRLARWKTTSDTIEIVPRSW